MAGEFLTALALVLVIEGVIYALFPDAMKRMMLRLMDTPAGALRVAGLALVMIGVCLVWLLRG